MKRYSCPDGMCGADDCVRCFPVTLPEKPEEPGPCVACGGLGWLCVNSDNAGKLEIQRCDACCRYDTDDDAVEAVDIAATRWFEHMQKETK